jgi:anti-anti-sigma factor
VARIELYGRQIAYIDSDGIRVLMHARRALHCRGGAFALRAPSATLRRALAATGLAWLFE